MSRLVLSEKQYCLLDLETDRALLVSGELDSRAEVFENKITPVIVFTCIDDDEKLFYSLDHHDIHIRHLVDTHLIIVMKKVKK